MPYPLSNPRRRLLKAATVMACLRITAFADPSAQAQSDGGEIIAHSGSLEVTQKELDDELRLANVPADQRTDKNVKAALTQIIARKFMAQEALAAKLDQEPEVRLDLSRVRDQVLAQAYRRQELATRASAISIAEIERYIHAHPEQFARRQLFQIEHISFAPPSDMDAISAAVKDAKTLDQVAAKLNEFGVQFTRGPATLDGGALPADVLKALRTRKADDLFFIQSKASADYFKVISIDERPLAGQEADKLALQQLTIDLGAKITQQAVDAALATVKYEGDYARVMAAPKPPNDAAPPPAGKEKPAGDVQPSGEKPIHGASPQE